MDYIRLAIVIKLMIAMVTIKITVKVEECPCLESPWLHPSSAQ